MDIPALLVTAALLTALVAVCLLPVYADSADDRGDGRTDVFIPGYVRTPNHRPRTWAFLAISAVAGLLFLGWKRPSLPLLYSEGVRDVAVALTHDPASVNGYVARLRQALAFFAVAFIIAISLVVRARVSRRLVMLLHAVLYLAMTMLTQALMIAIGIATGWLVAPFGIEATLANLLIGGLVIMRLTFTAFALPRSTTVPLVRRPRLWDNLLTWCALVTVITLLVGLYAFLSQQANLGSVWQVFVPLYAVSMLFLLMFAPLWLIWWANRTLPSPGPDRPPVDIIIPAYNERDNIARLLRSIDIAAGRYGGPVRVVVSDDGSVDDTAELAAAEIATFRHARAEILTDENGGQAAALNRGIKITDAEIIVRVDADCVLGPDALVYSVPWFRDPDVGSVGAMEEPRTDTRTWFHEMRKLETVFQFRFARLGQSMVDGIVVIPGTFTAFRRGPAVTAGGFPIGMNGEDADLTMQIGRLGYRVVVNPRIRSYEDVPRSPGEFVEQRTRWARAGFHVYARHVPLRAGSPAPGSGSGPCAAASPGSPSRPAWSRPSSCSNSCSPARPTGRTWPRSHCCTSPAAGSGWPSACRTRSSTGTGGPSCSRPAGSSTRSCAAWPPSRPPSRSRSGPSRRSCGPVRRPACPHRNTRGSGPAGSRSAPTSPDRLRLPPRDG